jgi:hypothetical protein
MKNQHNETLGRSPLRTMPRLPWLAVIAAVLVGGVVIAVQHTDEASAQMAPYESAIESSMDDRAEEVMRQMSTKLAAAEAFTIRGRRSVDPELAAGTDAVQRTDIEVSIKRPNMLYAEARGEGDHRKMFYDGETFTLVDMEQGLYSTVDRPGNIDVLLRTLSQEYGFNPPVSDILVADPFAHLMRNVVAGKHLGQEQVDGKSTDHLRFEEEYLTWDLWVDSEEKVPVKMIAKVPGMEGTPKLVAEGIEVDLNPDLDEGIFVFDPTGESREIPMVPIGEEPTAAR